MERTELTKSYSQKIQLDRYEPVEVGVTQTATLDEDDDPEAVAQELHDQNVAIVSREITARIAAHEMTDDAADD